MRFNYTLALQQTHLNRPSRLQQMHQGRYSSSIANRKLRKTKNISFSSLRRRRFISLSPVPHLVLVIRTSVAQIPQHSGDGVTHFHVPTSEQVN